MTIHFSGLHPGTKIEEKRGKFSVLIDGKLAFQGDRAALESWLETTGKRYHDVAMLRSEWLKKGGKK